MLAMPSTDVKSTTERGGVFSLNVTLVCEVRSSYYDIFLNFRNSFRIRCDKLLIDFEPKK